MFPNLRILLDNSYGKSKLETEWQGIFYGQISDIEYESYISQPLTEQELASYQKYLKDWYLYTKELPRPFIEMLLGFSNGAVLFGDIIIPGYKRKDRKMSNEERELQPAGIEEITSLSWMPDKYFVVGKSYRWNTLYLLTEKQTIIEIKDDNVSYHHNKMKLLNSYENLYAWLEAVILNHKYVPSPVKTNPETIIKEHAKKVVWNSPVSAEELTRFENTYNLRLPSEYKKFLLEHNGGEINSPAGPTIAVLSVEVESNETLYVEHVEGTVLQVAMESDGEPVFLNCATGEVFQNQSVDAYFPTWSAWLEYAFNLTD
ncbi:SMI1/KNR4 family protein [Listeria booriae]|uniref:SMI1/KNR4 family protein n=1 Tax=Listeria booriae TaxID=1552123 RepID=A0A7X0XRD3_9LIST|nr:SMI1/KNR4 family protein [Listeria booriae]MBC1779282.1 SMI1/KNR4 family protein [Listeria booriae]